jgi:hypothetical protein
LFFKVYWAAINFRRNEIDNEAALVLELQFIHNRMAWDKWGYCPEPQALAMLV